VPAIRPDNLSRSLLTFRHEVAPERTDTDGVPAVGQSEKVIPTQENRRC
jgi:hypothetical protein